MVPARGHRSRDGGPCNRGDAGSGGCAGLPDQAITIVVPFGPGTPTTSSPASSPGHDDHAGPKRHRRQSASPCNIATDLVAKSRPDGYTLLIASMSNILNQVTGNSNPTSRRTSRP
jgi:tripartite-type tricarboxylate transporter receptor subunit TctC